MRCFPKLTHCGGPCQRHICFPRKPRESREEAGTCIVDLRSVPRYIYIYLQDGKGDELSPRVANHGCWCLVLPPSCKHRYDLLDLEATLRRQENPGNQYLPTLAENIQHKANDGKMPCVAMPSSEVSSPRVANVPRGAPGSQYTEH
jgi:hypothetical protein